MSDQNMTAGDVAAAEQRDAKERATALSLRLVNGASAAAHKIAGNWYVVTSGTGEGYDYAYDAGDVDIDEVSRSSWDYSAWCAGVSPDEDMAVVVAYYMAEGRELGAAGGGAILTDEQRAVLALARKWA